MLTNDASLRIVYMASSEIALPLLRKLFFEGAADRPKLIPVAVLTNPDSPVGRSKMLMPTPIARYAEFLKEKNPDLMLMKAPDLNDENFLAKLASCRPDLMLTFAYGKKLPEALLKMGKLPPINIHASLLPAYRGANPIRSVIEAGEEYTGVSFMRMAEEIDAGPVFEKHLLKIEADDDFASITRKTALLAAGKAPAFFRRLSSLVPEEQEHEVATHTRKLKTKDSYLDFSLTAKEIERKLRSLSPFPAARVVLEASNRRVFKAALVSQKEFELMLADLTKDFFRGQKPGKIFLWRKRLFVFCASKELSSPSLMEDNDQIDFLIEIKEMTAASGKALPIKEFWHSFVDVDAFEQVSED